VSWQGYAQIIVFLSSWWRLVKPLGAYMARVYEGEPVWLEKVLGRSSGSSTASRRLDAESAR
jgi:K+-transporting ATPase A subunit